MKDPKVLKLLMFIEFVIIITIISLVGTKCSHNRFTKLQDSLSIQISKRNILIQNQIHIIDSIKKINSQLILKNDKLVKTKLQIINHYEKIYLELPYCTNKQLDSIIRSNW